jgi:glycosyltransferase involved in cell wall biosynthesis
VAPAEDAAVKIALLSFEYPPETGFGGIGSYTWYQARALVKLGHEVHVLAGATGPTELRVSEHDGVRVHRYRGDGSLMRCLRPLAKWQLWWTKNRLENALSMYRGLRALRQQHRFDVVEMPECGAEGLLVNNLMRETTVVRFHSPARLIMPYYEVRPADIKWCSRAEQIGIRGADLLTACSHFVADEVKDKLGIRRPVQVIPNGIDVDLFDAAEQTDFRREFDLPRDRPVIFFSGRMEARKGVHLLKEIAASILERHDVALVLAGQDLFKYVSETLLPYLQSKQLRGSIHYLGKLDLAQVRSGLCQSDIFLLPSVWENCPYSCLEAMAAGRAIVCSNQGGMPELIQDGENGLLAASGDSASYVAQLERLIEDRSLRERLGSAARKTVTQSFSDVYTARISADYYLECLDRGSARAREKLAGQADAIPR